jgi:hypothetical protein
MCSIFICVYVGVLIVIIWVLLEYETTYSILYMQGP